MVATIARKTAEQKKADKLASLTIIGRATFKANGAQLYAVQSGEKTYHVTRIAGRVRSCVNAETGETCKTRQYGNDTCCHGEAVEMLEAKRQNELAVAAQVAPLIVGEQFASDLQVHAEDEFSAQADLPVVVIDYDKTNAWIIWGNEAVCGRVSDLDYACPDGYQLAGEDGVERLNAILHKKSEPELHSCVSCGYLVKRADSLCHKCAA